MRIAVLGTGVVGRTLARGLARVGHHVVIGTRDPESTLAAAETDQHGSVAFAAWLRENSGIGLATFADAAEPAELVVFASAGARAMDVLRAAGARNLEGKVLLDVSNPLDFTTGYPPTLFVKDTDSLAEQIQRAVPRARVVKALNTVSSYVMADPTAIDGGDHTVFVSSDDGDAAEAVTSLLHELGWKDVLTLGGLSTARGPEMYVGLWLRMLAAIGKPEFNVRVVR